MELQEVLTTAKTIAVVGCSERPDRISHQIAHYLIEQGYRVIPVNPLVSEVLGQPAFPDLQSIDHDVTIDIVNIFRRPMQTTEAVRDAITRARATGEHYVIWTQVGCSSPEAESLAKAADLPYVRNACIYTEHLSSHRVRD